MKNDSFDWFKLDNAAKIFPGQNSKSWSNVFRLSVTLTEPVDTEVLQRALDVTALRFPSICARLRRGLFWYYLQQLEQAPQLSPERSYPLTYMSPGEIRKCAFRVIAYENRIAVELFHALTDGTGAMIFLKSLTAEYLEQKYGLKIPAEKVGTFDTELAEEFFRAFAHHAGITLHIRQLAGGNSHHIIEGAFKSVARSLRTAAAIDPAFAEEIPSTKGVL